MRGAGDGQLALFELPEAEGAGVEAPAELPESLRQLLEVGFPGEALGRLVEGFGGVVLYVPKSPGDDSRLVQVLGEGAAWQLCRHLGGCRFAVPRGYRAALAARNAGIRRDADAGVPMAELVRRYQITERQVWKVLGEG
ncbi:MAG: Mor transcription activator family protein [Thermodesulfobacteriota bacterium]